MGGGEVAERKATALLEAGALVTIVSPTLCPGLEKMLEHGDVKHISRSYAQGDLDSAYLAIAATDDSEVNWIVADEARRLKVLVNVVDDPSHCDFVLPAVIRQGDLLITVSTGGRSPAVARHIRRRLEHLAASEFVGLLDLVGQIREELMAQGQRFPGEAWQRALDDEFLGLLRDGEVDRARTVLLAHLGDPARAEISLHGDHTESA